MTDRELLELAAKAAGMETRICRATEQLRARPHGSGDLFPLWNPLTDDGDALRLAGKLRINIEHMRTLKGDDFGVNCWPTGRGDCASSEDGDLSNYIGAVRRAIVLAAAEIGKGMP